MRSLVLNFFTRNTHFFSYFAGVNFFSGIQSDPAPGWANPWICSRASVLCKKIQHLSHWQVVFHLRVPVGRASPRKMADLAHFARSLSQGCNGIIYRRPAARVNGTRPFSVVFPRALGERKPEENHNAADDHEEEEQPEEEAIQDGGDPLPLCARRSLRLLRLSSLTHQLQELRHQHQLLHLLAVDLGSQILLHLTLLLRPWELLDLLWHLSSLPLRLWPHSRKPLPAEQGFEDVVGEGEEPGRGRQHGPHVVQGENEDGEGDGDARHAHEQQQVDPCRRTREHALQSRMKEPQCSSSGTRGFQGPMSSIPNQTTQISATRALLLFSR